jgi:hypothetical protein
MRYKYKAPYASVPIGGTWIAAGLVVVLSCAALLGLIIHITAHLHYDTIGGRILEHLRP